MFGPADMSTAKAGGTAENPVVVADVPAGLLPGAAGRFNKALPLGIEGAGLVEATGGSQSAKALLGKTVALMGGALYAEYRIAKADQCLVMPEGTSATEAASCFVNPLTVLGMVETMRMEGHGALVHSAAASNLGQMLQKLCLDEGVGLVNIVRRPEHVDLLKSLGAKYVCDSEPGLLCRRPRRSTDRHEGDPRLRRDRRGPPRRRDHPCDGDRAGAIRCSNRTLRVNHSQNRSTSTAASTARLRLSTGPSGWHGGSVAG